MSTGNITLCLEQHTARKKRVEQVWFNLCAILSCFPCNTFGSLFITTYITRCMHNLKGTTQHHNTHFFVTIFIGHVDLPCTEASLTNFCSLDFQNQLAMICNRNQCKANCHLLATDILHWFLLCLDTTLGATVGQMPKYE
jgi:hypothetical protein